MVKHRQAIAAVVWPAVLPAHFRPIKKKKKGFNGNQTVLNNATAAPTGLFRGNLVMVSWVFLIKRETSFQVATSCLLQRFQL